MPLNYKIIFFLVFFKILIVNSAFGSDLESNFENWLSSYKKFALEKGISQETINIAFKNVKFLDQVIKYDRKQPEFIEDTITYVSKRASTLRANKAKKILQRNKILFNDIEGKFFVEKEILVALWGIETNFGKHVGKMDIISCLATLSYDKRRSSFFFISVAYFIKINR